MSGALATQYTPTETREERVVREVHSILYWLNKENPRGSKPSDPTRDQQFTLWETPIRKWAEEQKLADQTDAEVIPTKTDEVHKLEFAPTISITSPTPGTGVRANEQVRIIINAVQKKFALLKAELYINGVFAGSSFAAPFSFSFIPEDNTSITQNNEIRVVVYDVMLNRADASVTISVVE